MPKCKYSGSKLKVTVLFFIYIAVGVFNLLLKALDMASEAVY